MLDASKFNRLPEYAKDEIRILTKDLNEARNDLAELAASIAGNRPTGLVRLERYIDVDRHLELPNNTCVVFGPNTIGAGIRCKLDDYGWLDINGQSEIVMQPWAANHVRVRILNRYTKDRDLVGADKKK